MRRRLGSALSRAIGPTARIRHPAPQFGQRPPGPAPRASVGQHRWPRPARRPYSIRQHPRKNVPRATPATWHAAGLRGPARRRAAARCRPAGGPRAPASAERPHAPPAARGQRQGQQRRQRRRRRSSPLIGRRRLAAAVSATAARAGVVVVRGDIGRAGQQRATRRAVVAGRAAAAARAARGCADARGRRWSRPRPRLAARREIGAQLVAGSRAAAGRPRRATGSAPRRPRVPVPRRSRSSTVSAWSSRVCATATCAAPQAYAGLARERRSGRGGRPLRPNSAAAASAPTSAARPRRRARQPAPASARQNASSRSGLVAQLVVEVGDAGQHDVRRRSASSRSRAAAPPSRRRPTPPRRRAPRAARAAWRSTNRRTRAARLVKVVLANPRAEGCVPRGPPPHRQCYSAAASAWLAEPKLALRLGSAERRLVPEGGLEPPTLRL